MIKMIDATPNFGKIMVYKFFSKYKKIIIISFLITVSYNNGIHV